MTDPQTTSTTRREVLTAASWTIPIVTLAAATPLAAASPPRVYGFESSFGVGWYPTAQGQTSSGALQYDADYASKYHRITGTRPGDVITNVYVDVLISAGWPAPTFSPIPGSNTQWTTLANTGATTVVDGVSYRIYRTTFTGTVTATSGTTDIPIGFYFRSSSPYYAGQTAQTRRYATINGTSLQLIRAVAPINNTNVVNYPRP